MIIIKSNKKRAVFTLEDRRTLIENAKTVRYELLDAHPGKVAFYRYADSSAFLFAEITQISLEGERLTAENAEEKLSVFFQKLEQTHCTPISEDYLPLSGGTLTGNLTIEPIQHGSLKIKDSTTGFYSYFNYDGMSGMMNIGNSVYNSEISIKGDISLIPAEQYKALYKNLEIATVNDIITQTNGEGNKYLADDGNYYPIDRENTNFIINGENEEEIYLYTPRYINLSCHETISEIDIGYSPITKKKTNSTHIWSDNTYIGIGGSNPSNQIVIAAADGASTLTFLNSRSIHINNIPVENELSSIEYLYTSRTGMLMRTPLSVFTDLHTIKRISGTGTTSVSIPENAQIVSVNYNRATLFSDDYHIQDGVLSVTNHELIENAPVNSRIEVSYM